MYIVVEGPIGAGKTSLTNLISDYFEYKAIFEIVTENPFLEKFYINPTRWGFETEMYFLASRYTQMKKIKLAKSDDKNIVADYTIYKNLIFAKRNLEEEEFNKFRNVFYDLTDDFEHPDLYVFINISMPTLTKRIARRGRDFELSIDLEYLEYLVDQYNIFIQKLVDNNKNVLIINGDEIDFVNDMEDRKYVQQLLSDKIEEIKGQKNDK